MPLVTHCVPSFYILPSFIISDCILTCSYDLLLHYFCFLLPYQYFDCHVTSALQIKDFGVPFANSGNFIRKLHLTFCKKKRFPALYYNIIFTPTIYNINIRLLLYLDVCLLLQISNMYKSISNMAHNLGREKVWTQQSLSMLYGLEIKATEL